MPEWRTDDDGGRGRTYLGPDGERWPSFTTLTGLVPGKAEGLAAWRARVGADEAQAHTQRAVDRGNLIHAELEQGRGPEAVRAWLDKHVESSYAELTLADTDLRAAGTADLVARMKDGRIAVIDWKTGRRRPEHALQVVGYGDCDLVLTSGRWVSWPLMCQAELHLVGYIDPDGSLSIARARADEATRSVLVGLRQVWAWHEAQKGALRAWRP